MHDPTGTKLIDCTLCRSGGRLPVESDRAIFTMRCSIFDSEAEKALYATLTGRWSRYANIYPQVPLRKVLGYQAIRQLDLPERAKTYLLQSEFDFLVCYRESDEPFLAIEFDGVGHGYSTDARYVGEVELPSDPYRKLKLTRKLEACDSLLFPLVVISFPEVQGGSHVVTVLDAVVSLVYEAVRSTNEIDSRLEEIGETFSDDPSGETASMMIMEIETTHEMQNPIRRRIEKMKSKLPMSGMSLRYDSSSVDQLGVTAYFSGGIDIRTNSAIEQALLPTSVTIRQVNCPGADARMTGELLAQYALCRRALREVGTDAAQWQELLQNTPWTAIL